MLKTSIFWVRILIIVVFVRCVSLWTPLYHIFHVWPVRRRCNSTRSIVHYWYCSKLDTWSNGNWLKSNCNNLLGTINNQFSAVTSQTQNTSISSHTIIVIGQDLTCLSQPGIVRFYWCCKQNIFGFIDAVIKHNNKILTMRNILDCDAQKDAWIWQTIPGFPTKNILAAPCFLIFTRLLSVWHLHCDAVVKATKYFWGIDVTFSM